VITDRDKQLFSHIFENRVMSLTQLHHQIFTGRSFTVAARRIGELCLCGYLDRKFIEGAAYRARSVYQITDSAFQEMAPGYPHKITAELIKSDSVKHDLALVDLRNRLQRLKSVSAYFTENMLQACSEFSEHEETRPFVVNNSDASVELSRQGKTFLVGLEFENSEKALDRYIRKLVSYYSDPRTSVILYVCENPKIRNTVAKAEAEVAGSRSLRCHYALLPEVLKSDSDCTFQDLKGGRIVLS
jgi:hypothetical protein